MRKRSKLVREKIGKLAIKYQWAWYSLNDRKGIEVYVSDESILNRKVNEEFD